MPKNSPTNKRSNEPDDFTNSGSSGRKSDRQRAFEIVMKSFAGEGLFTRRVYQVFDEPPSIATENDTISKHVAKLVMNKISETSGAHLKRIFFDVGVQAFASGIAVVEQALEQRRYFILSTLNAAVALYAQVRGKPYVTVEFYGNTFDRLSGAMGKPDGEQFNDTDVETHKRLIENSSLIVQGAISISVQDGIYGSAEHRILEKLRRQQILSANGAQSVIIPMDWSKLTASKLPPTGIQIIKGEGPNGDSELRKYASKILLVSVYDGTLQNESRQDYMNALKDLDAIGIKTSTPEVPTPKP